ncbi:MAG TPA: hypothetical protein VN957_11850 [Chthoniobacterales bacterium]|nr:hypothetical protein [Chthoniobacterales bacterium]
MQIPVQRFQSAAGVMGITGIMGVPGITGAPGVTCATRRSPQVYSFFQG